MEYEQVISAISSVGFPIVACIFMFFLNKSQDERHEQEIDKIASVINELKIVIAELKERITTR